jgi:hypothetical protein
MDGGEYLLDPQARREILRNPDEERAFGERMILREASRFHIPGDQRKPLRGSIAMDIIVRPSP